VLQGAEVYKGKPIFYSLGNLVSPRPGTTAVFKLRYQGRAFVGVNTLPANISGGKTVPVPTKSLKVYQSKMVGLCTALVRRYPNPNSVALVRPMKQGK